MFQPVQYYHTKMQLAQMELEDKLQMANLSGKKRKTGSSEIMERMRKLALEGEVDEDADILEDEEGADSGEGLYKDDAEIRQIQDPDLNSEVQSEAEFVQESEDSQNTPGGNVSEKSGKKQKKLRKKKTEAESESKTQESASEIPEAVVQNQVQNSGNEQKPVQTFSAEQMQDRMIWAEILGEPVSVKRRKKRMERLYGNQSHAYRR